MTPSVHPSASGTRRGRVPNAPAPPPDGEVLASVQPCGVDGPHLDLLADGARMRADGEVVASFCFPTSTGDRTHRIGQPGSGGGAWDCTETFREHSAVSLSYVAFSLTQQLVDRGATVVDLPGHRDSLAAALAVDDTLLLWLLRPEGPGHCPGLLKVVLRRVG